MGVFAAGLVALHEKKAPTPELPPKPILYLHLQGLEPWTP